MLTMDVNSFKVILESLKCLTTTGLLTVSIHNQRFHNPQNDLTLSQTSPGFYVSAVQVF